MKTFKSILGMLLFAAVAMAFTSCTSNNENGGEPDPGPDPVVPVDPTNPTDQKAYMESTAKEFLNKFNPDDQRELLGVANTFVNEYADLDMPDEYYSSPAVNYAKQLVKMFGNGNYLASSRTSDIYRFADYTGHFKAQGDAWVKTADAADIQFSFTQGGQTCTITATKSGSEWSLEADGATIIIPSTITVTVAKGNTTLASTTVNTAYNEAGHTASVKVSLTAGAYAVSTETNVTDTKITETQKFSIAGSNLVNTTATINGNNLGNASAISDLIDSEDVNALDSYFTSAEANVQILDKILIKSSGESFSAIANAMDYDDTSESAAKRAANILNNHLITRFYYDSGTVQQGTINFESFVYNPWGSYSYYDIRPVMKFGSDNTTYDFESYFGNGKFDSIETLFGNLLEKYSSMIDF